MAFSAALFAQSSESTPLPTPDKTGGKPLMQCLAERKTARSFSDKKLSGQQLSNLLFAAWGINRKDGRHTAPTARNLQDMSVYVAMDKGVYLFEPATHSLKILTDKDLRGILGKQEKMFRSAPVVLIYVSDTNHYSKPEDKILYPANHAGYISQNVYLFAASEGLNTVVCGAIDRDQIAKALNLKNGVKVMFTQPIGYPAENPK